MVRDNQERKRKRLRSGSRNILKRKLTAIFYADVASYSRLTGEDEDGTHRRLSQYLDFIADFTEQKNGRVVH